ncbi:MAG TPA: hypothetical protein VHE12_02525 [bacterium]|nr:hypothetical protein [bacterium]
MKKGLLMLLAGFMALGVAVKASASARLDGMAADVRQVEDIDLIWLYPNKVIDYKNTVDFRLADDYNGWGGGTNEWGGAIVDEKAAGLGVIGVYVNRPHRMYSAWANLANHPYGLQPLSGETWANVGNDWFVYGLHNNQRNLDLFWADSLGSTADLGIHFTYGDGLDNQGGFPSTYDSQDYSLAVGLGFTDVAPFNQLNVHAEYQMQNASFNNGSLKDNGISSILIGAMGSADLSSDNSIRPFIDTRIDSENLTDIAGDPFSWSGWGLMFGASCAHKVNGGKGTVSTGLTFDYYGADQKDPNFDSFGSFTADQYYAIWNAMVESQMNSWLTLRTGIAKLIFARDYVSNNTANATWYDPTNDPVVFSMGFSVAVENFTLDASIDVNSLENSLANIQPGNGIFFGSDYNENNNNVGAMFQVATADLKYKF